jgi:phosphatidylglycerophosphatase C
MGCPDDCETGAMDDAPRARVAAFDLDGTLTDGGSVFGWLCFLAGRARAYRAAASLLGPLALGALRSGPSADRAKERLFVALLDGLDARDATARSRAFAIEHLARHARPEVVARLEWHQRHGHQTVVVSASPQLYVDVVAECLGTDGAIGTRLATDAQGRLTGRYLERNCRGPEKVRRFDEWLASNAAGPSPEVFAYGNSRGDRRLLARADHAFNVGRIGRWGRLRRFPSLPARPWKDEDA